MAAGSQETINYQVHYNYYGNIIQNVVSVQINRYLAPRQDTFEFTVADIGGNPLQVFDVAREVQFYRVSQSGQKLMFRGATTNIDYSLTPQQKITTVSGKGLWYLLTTRLLKLDGATPVGFPTNPFIMTINPLLNQQFLFLFTMIVNLGFQQNYTTGYLPSINPINTDFDTVVVNDQMFLQYESIEQALDRLVQSALPGLLGELKLDFTVTPPTLTVKRFDPINGFYGIGSNKSSTINFIEGQNIAQLDFSFDFDSMANSIILTGAQFRGSQLIAVPINNNQSIAKYGLKQIQKSIGNVVDQDAIYRYANNLLPLLQFPIPTIKITPVYTYALTSDITSLEPGDVITITSPSLASVLNLSNNQFTARVIEIDRTWSVSSGEQITITLTYPVQTGGQPIFQYAGSTLDTQLAILQNQLSDALYQTTEAPSENLVVGA
jgi:hypothetical protein